MSSDGRSPQHRGAMAAQAPVRTPLRNISNANGHAAPLPQHKAILALRGGGDKTGPQVRGAQISLATSPMQVQRAAMPTRSPMTGSTPDDVRRAAKKAPVLRPGDSTWKEVVDAKTGKPYYWNTSTNETTWRQPQEMIPCIPFSVVSGQLQQCFAQALVAAQTEGILNPFQNTGPLDPIKEAARIKRENAKAKREAKAAQKAEQERLRLEQEQQEAQERAALLEHQNDAVLDVISTMSDTEEGCLFEELEPLRSVPHELISLGQSLHAIAIASEVYMLPLELHQVEDALRARKSSPEHENVLAALHTTLLGVAKGDTKASSSKSATSSWMTDVKKWAFAEFGGRSPFFDATLCRQKKEGALEYKQLTYAQRLSLLHDLSAAAMTTLLAAQDTSEQLADSLRHTPLGVDSQGRVYWHGVNPSDTASTWVLRESLEQQPQRSRLSVLSSDGTPVKGDKRGETALASPGVDTQPPIQDEQVRVWEEKDAPERGEAGDNFYWHQQWVLVMARASRPDFHSDKAPELELLTSDVDMVCGLVKALWQAGTTPEQQLARSLVSKVPVSHAARHDEQPRKMPPRVRRHAPRAAGEPALVSAL